MFLKEGLIYEDDLIRLINFIFECEDEKIIKRCLDLNPMEIDGLVEEVSFYINMPHPFDPMPVREKYKNSMIGVFKYIQKILKENTTREEINRFRKEFHSIKRDYEKMELQCWSGRYHKMLSEIDKVLKYKK